MINEWRLRYGRIYRAEKIFRVVSFLGLGTTGLGIAGLVFAGSACDEDEDPCTIRQASWGITGTGSGSRWEALEGGSPIASSVNDTWTRSFKMASFGWNRPRRGSC